MPRVHRSRHSRHGPRPPLPVAQPREAAPRLHRLEKALLVVVAAHLVFLPWALGTMHVWSQGVSFGFSVLSLGLALRPRTYSEEYTGGEAFRLHTLPKLLRFPIFWLGLAFLLYILIQALNPAWEYVRNDRFWWLQGVSCIDWLPTGMRTPFAQANPWRSLMIYSSAWMTVCAIWTGFTRRKSLRILLVSLAVNAFLLALFGLIQRALHADKIFWFWQPPADYFVASFIYKNHAGAYLDLLLSLCAGLAWWYYARGQRRMEKSNPGVLFAFFAIVLGVMVLFSYSRAATVLMLVYLIAVVVVFAIRQVFSAGSERNVFVISILLIVLGGFIAVGLYSLRIERVVDHMERLFEEDRQASVVRRELATTAALEMAQDRIWTGWGAGSFRFYFPEYQRHYPSIMKSPEGRTLLWEHAHDDYAEMLAEVGVIGVGILTLGFAWWLVRLSRIHFWANPFALPLGLGCLVTLAHGRIDFPFCNPAILITWCVCWPVMLRWAEIERQRTRAEPSGT